MMTHSIRILTVLAAAFVSTPVSAAVRTVCTELRFYDERVSADCAHSNEAGALRGCNPDGDTRHYGAVVELWDKDPNGTDEKIGTFPYNNATGTCWTFEWDNNATANAEHEPHPDVYVRYIFHVTNSQFTRRVSAWDWNGVAVPPVTFRNGITGNPDIYVANECSSLCWIFPTGSLRPTAIKGSTISLRANALDSAQHSLEVFHTNMNADVAMRVPGTCSIGSSCSTGPTTFRVTIDASLRGVVVGHEMGHCIQQQILGVPLVNNCSLNGGGWSLTGTEYESCASQEGLASYVGVASWYDGGVANVNPSGWGLSFEVARPDNTSSCIANASRGIQVAKAFWDMDDVNSDGPVSPAVGWDLDAWVPPYILSGYSLFPSGTGNRQKSESDVNGVNVQDYVANTNAALFGGSGNQYSTMLTHNCLNAQDLN